MRRRVWLVGLGAVLVAIVGMWCSGSGPATQPHTLTSGRTIRVLNVGTMHFAASAPALVLQYQTDLKVDQLDEVRKELAEVWKDFRQEVDKAKLSNAIIMVHEVPTGVVIKHNKQYNFVFARRTDGSWPEEPSK